MVFSSMLFVFFFLTANLISQILLKTPKQKNIAMVIFSLFQLIAEEKKMKKNAVQEAAKEVDPWDQVSVQ